MVRSSGPGQGCKGLGMFGNSGSLLVSDYVYIHGHIP